MMYVLSLFLSVQEINDRIFVPVTLTMSLLKIEKKIISRTHYKPERGPARAHTHTQHMHIFTLPRHVILFVTH